MSDLFDVSADRGLHHAMQQIKKINIICQIDAQTHRSRHHQVM